MKNIFITGIAGLLGSNCAYLLRDKYNIFGVDKNVVNIENVATQVFSAFDTYKIEEMLTSNNIDVLIHCAALVNLDICEKMPDYAELLNCQLTENLYNACNKHGIKLIFVSTDAVYDGKKQGLNKEDDVPNPVSVYGRTKLKAENIVLKNPNNLIFRTNMYGFNYREKNSFGEWVLQMLNSDEELNMFNDISFSPMLVNKLVEVIDISIEKNLCGLYNLACTGAITKFDLGVAIQKAFKIRGTINSVCSDSLNFIAPRTKNMGLDNTKIKDALNIEINNSIEDVVLFKELYDKKYSSQLKKGK